MQAPLYMSAAEATAFLGISAATLYAYVSRGLIQSCPDPERSRNRLYLKADIIALKERQRRRRDPMHSAATALNWGAPILPTAISRIDGSRLFYRGHDACELAASATLDELAMLLWRGTLTAWPELYVWAKAPWPAAFERQLASLSQDQTLDPITLLQCVLPLAELHDPMAFDLSQEGAQRAGARCWGLFARCLLNDVLGDPSTLTSALVERWSPHGDPHHADQADAAELLRMALILCAEHELNISSFTARCAASASTSVYGAIGAALAVLKGRRHAGTTERIWAMLREAKTPAQLHDTILSRQRRGDSIPGFGLPLYPEGDPRADMIISQLRIRRPSTIPWLDAVAAISRDVLNGRPPVIDLALVLLVQSMGWPPSTSISIFGMARVLGWSAHIIEQLQADRLIRPRAHYVGDDHSSPSQ